MKIIKSKIEFTLLTLIYLVISACGTRAGNPDEDGEGEGDEAKVEIISPAFEPDDFGALSLAETNEFMFCVSTLKIKAKGIEDSDQIKFQSGLIDGSSANEVSWGSADITHGSYDEVHAVLTAKQGACGVDYSLKYNDTTIYTPINLKWTLDPVVEVDADTSIIELSLNEIAKYIGESIDNGGNEAEIVTAAENTKGRGGKGKSSSNAQGKDR